MCRAASRGHIPLKRMDPNILDPLARLVDILQKSQNHLPKIDPEVFMGVIYKYSLWIKSFETFIERKTKSSTERLYYMHLGRYTVSEVRQAISGYLLLRNSKGKHTCQG